MKDTKGQLGSYLNRSMNFGTGEVDLMFSKMTKRTYAKKAVILNQEEIATHRYFILEGLVRVFHTNEKGIETINQFAIENWWVASVESFVEHTPSHYAIQAIEKTTVLSIAKADLEELYISIPKLERFFRKITERMLMAIIRKNEVFMKYPSYERYRFFVDSVPGFAQRVPQYMIASYLDISPEYLSEIRNNSDPMIS